MIKGFFEVFVLWIVLAHLVSKGRPDQVAENVLEGDLVIIIISSSSESTFVIFFAVS